MSVGGMKFRSWTTGEEAKLRMMWSRKTGKEIALILNRTHKAVARRASDLGLKCDRRAEYGPEFEVFLRKKHAKGWSDADVAREWGGSEKHVRTLRNRLSLPHNRRSERQRAKCKRSYRRLARGTGMAWLVKFREQEWRLELVRRGLPIDLRRPHARILEHLERGPATRRELCAALGLKYRGGRSLTRKGNLSATAELQRMQYIVATGWRRLVIDGRTTKERLYGIAPGFKRDFRVAEAA